MKVWDRAWIKLETPGSAARHVTDCTTRPSENSLVYKIIKASSWFNSLKTRNPLVGTLANSEDPDEMLHYAAFLLGLHCLLI